MNSKINAVKILALGFGCAALVWITTPINAGNTLPANAAALRANAGNKFALVPTNDPYVLGHPVDGVAQVSLLGNCHFHGDGEVHLPTSAGQPIVIVSTSPWTLIASDGTNSLQFDVQGTATFDPVNPNFANLSYTATFVGGTGAFVGATGTATFEVTAQFESALEGWATWTMKGYVITPPSVP
jgi:hypothetical protein